jgi:UDP-glucuronate decarboxylase
VRHPQRGAPLPHCPDERAIADFAATVQRLCGTSLPIIHRALPVDDPARRRPDIGKAQRLLGRRPTVAPGDGLRRTTTRFRADPAGAGAEQRPA